MFAGILLIITGEVSSASDGQRPGMLLNIPQYAGQPPQQKLPPPRLSRVLKLSNPDLGNRDTMVNEIDKMIL